MGSPVTSNIGEDVRTALQAAVNAALTKLSGRAFSPRIKLLSIEDVCAATTLGKTAIYDLIEKGGFPKPIKVGGRNGWRESTLIAWMDRNDPNRDEPWMKETR